MIEYKNNYTNEIVGIISYDKTNKMYRVAIVTVKGFLITAFYNKRFPVIKKCPSFMYKDKIYCFDLFVTNGHYSVNSFKYVGVIN